MDKRDEFSKWISAVEEALSGSSKPLEEDKPAECGCGKWNCTACFPDEKSGSSVKLGDIVTKTEFRKTGGEDSPLTHGEDNLDETPDGFDDDEFEEYDDRDFQDDGEDRSMFADPGGNSALRAETDDNPRVYPCPSCGAEDALTLQDKRLGYQCDRCADAAEGGFDIDEVDSNMEVEQPLFGEEEPGLDQTDDGMPLTGDENSDDEDAPELRSAIEYMQDSGFSNSDKMYRPEELASMPIDELRTVHSEVMGGVQEATTVAADPDDLDPPKPTKIKPIDYDPNDDDDLLSSRPDQPLTNIPGDDELPQDDSSSMNLPTGSRADAQNAMRNMVTTDAMRRSMNLINYAAGDDEPANPVQPENELVVRTARDVPAVISNAMRATGFVSPTWYLVRDLPGMNSRNIRAMGRDVFSLFTSTPVEDIKTIANLGGQGPSTDREMRAVASWIYHNAEDLGEKRVDFSHVIPGYRPMVKEYRANGVRFQVVVDDHGQYIYAYPDKDATAYVSGEEGPLALGGNTPMLGRNTPRLREGKGMSNSLLSTLKLVDDIRDAVKQVAINEDIKKETLAESNLSAILGYGPGQAGKQPVKQGEWNLMKWLHARFKFDDIAKLRELPKDRNTLNGMFKAHPDHFMIIKGTKGAAAVRPDPEYHAWKRGKVPDWNVDQTDVNDSAMPYQVIAFNNEGARIPPEVFKAADEVEKEKTPSKSAKPSSNSSNTKSIGKGEYTITDPTVRKSRFGRAHMRKPGPTDIFDLLDREIGYEHGGSTWLAGFYSLRADAPKHPDRTVEPAEKPINRDKLAHRAVDILPTGKGSSFAGKNSIPRTAGGVNRSAERNADLEEPAGANRTVGNNKKYPAGSVPPSPVFDKNTKKWRKGQIASQDKPGEQDIWEKQGDEAKASYRATRKANIDKEKNRRDKLKYSGPVPQGAAMPARNVSQVELFKRIRPILAPVIQKASSDIYLNLDKANKNRNYDAVEKWGKLGRLIDQFSAAINTSGNIRWEGPVAAVMDSAITEMLKSIVTKKVNTPDGSSAYVPMPTHDPMYQRSAQNAIFDLSTGPVKDLIPLVRAIEDRLVGAVA